MTPLPGFVLHLSLSTYRTDPIGPAGQAMLALLCLVIGGLIALVGLGYLRTYNSARKTDPVPIRRLTDTDSEVELSGTVEAHEQTSEAPFTYTECVACEWEAQRHREDRDGSDWVGFASGERRHPFRLDDGTGSVLVDPESATLEMTTEETIEVDADASPPPAVEEYLAETDGIDVDPGRRHRYVERRLDLGEDVHVFGPVRRADRSTDGPSGAATVVGVDDSNRGFTLGEDGLTDLVDQIKSDTVQFTITPGGERAAERLLLRRGLYITGFGVVFGLLPLAFVLVL